MNRLIIIGWEKITDVSKVKGEKDTGRREEDFCVDKHESFTPDE